MRTSVGALPPRTHSISRRPREGLPRGKENVCCRKTSKGTSSVSGTPPRKQHGHSVTVRPASVGAAKVVPRPIKTFYGNTQVKRSEPAGAAAERKYNKEWKMKFDIVVGNPPFNSNAHLKILEKTIDVLGQKAVIIHPSNWFFIKTDYFENTKMWQTI